MGEPARRLSPAERHELRHPSVRFRAPEREAPDLDGVDLVEHFRRVLHLRNRNLRVFLANICRLSREHGCTYFGQKYIADHIGVSVRTVYRWTCALVELGLVTTRRTGRELQISPIWESLGLREVTEEVSDRVSTQVSDRTFNSPERSEEQQQGAGAVAPAAAVPKSPRGRAKQVARPSLPELPSGLAERLWELPGGRSAARTLARSGLPEPLLLEAVERLEEKSRRGLDDAGKYIHAVIRGLRERQEDWAAEQAKAAERAARSAERERQERERAAAYEASCARANAGERYEVADELARMLEKLKAEEVERVRKVEAERAERARKNAEFLGEKPRVEIPTKTPPPMAPGVRLYLLRREEARMPQTSVLRGGYLLEIQRLEKQGVMEIAPESGEP